MPRGPRTATPAAPPGRATAAGDGNAPRRQPLPAGGAKYRALAAAARVELGFGLGNPDTGTPEP